MTKYKYMICTGKEWWETFTAVKTLTEASRLKRAFPDARVYELKPVKFEAIKSKRSKKNGTR